MRGGALPAALLCAALAFALCFGPRRAAVPALVLLAATAVAASLLPIQQRWSELVFAGCWLGTGLTALAVHLPARWQLTRGAALLLAANAGGWAGAVIAISGTPGDLARALPAALLVFPGRWLVANRYGIAIKVVASWLVAVAIMAGTLPIVTTPGYVPDHME